jgi:serpin B
VANVFISPLSAAMALGMAYNGAAGTTREAMARALSLQGMSVGEVNQSFRDLIDLLRRLDSQVEFRLANSIWHRPQVTPLRSFLDTNRRYFDATVQALDFADPGAASTINRWVEENTAGRIKKIVPEPIPPHIVTYLINAIYFKGAWTYQFDKKLTRDQPFRLADGGQVTVPMMSLPGARQVRLLGDEEVTVVDLPYSRQAFAMTILLPHQADGASRLATQLTAEQWNGWISRLDSTRALVSLPKFTLEYAVRLNDVLKALGMAEAFDPCRADFSNMFAVLPGKNYYIDDVRHKTFVQVNEEGTEAAGATSVGIAIVSAPPLIQVDRPFIFAIRERLSGTILFLGKIMNPAVNQPREIESRPETCAVSLTGGRQKTPASGDR